MIKPLPGYVLIETLEAEGKTTSGFVLPENADEKPIKGKVLAVGDMVVRESFIEDTALGQKTKMVGEQSPVGVGQIAIFRKWSGQDVQDGDKTYKLVEFKDLLGVVE